MVRAHRMGGGAGVPGGGTVTSVGLAMPAIFSVAGSPITTAGTFTVTLATQTANTVFAGPTSGGAAVPTFRALVALDYPVMVGDSGAGGVRGAVPAPAAGDAGKFLRGDGTWVTVSGTGTVTSVGLTAPAEISVAGSPVTTSGTFALTWANQSANIVFAGPSSGGAATPSFRALVANDYPTMVGDSGAGGTKGAVPAPAAGDAAAGKFLKADGTWAAPSGSGTVTSVGLTMPAVFSVAGSPVTTSGTLAVTLATQTANTVWAGPTSGGAATPTFRALVANDYVTMVGDSGAGGTKGAVPAPAAGDAAAGKFLKADGTWAAPGGGSAQWTSTGGQFKIASGAITAGDQVYIQNLETSATDSIGTKLDSSNDLRATGALDRSLVSIYSAGVGVWHFEGWDWTTVGGYGGALALFPLSDASIAPSATGCGAIGGYGDGGSSRFVTFGIRSSTSTPAIDDFTVGISMSSVGNGYLKALDVGIDAGKKLGLGGSDRTTAPTTYFVKSSTTGGNLSTFYDSGEITRYDGTDYRFLRATQPGAYQLIGDASAAYRFGGIVKINTTSVGNVGTGEDNLITYALPAGYLGGNGQSLIVEAWGTFASNPNAKRVRLYFGATAVFDTTAQNFTGGAWAIRARIVRTGTTTQISVASFDGDTSLVVTTAQTAAPAETLSNSVTIKATGEATSTDDIVQLGLIVRYEPASN